MEVDGGGSDNLELLAKLPSQGSCGGDLQREKSQPWGPQDVPNPQTCSFPSEFIAAFINQKGTNGFGFTASIKKKHIRYDNTGPDSHVATIT